MKHAVSRELFECWTQLRAGRAAPEWSKAEPALPRGILADVVVLSVDDLDASRAPIRTAGARLAALCGGALQGTPLPDLFKAEDRGAVLRLLRDVLDHQGPALAGLRAAPPGDHRGVDLEMLLLPLRHGGRTHARVLGSVAPFQLPSWLGLGPVDAFSLVSVRFPYDGEEPASFARRTPPLRHRHLLVHDGGRTD